MKMTIRWLIGKTNYNIGFSFYTSRTYNYIHNMYFNHIFIKSIWNPHFVPLISTTYILTISNDKCGRYVAQTAFSHSFNVCRVNYIRNVNYFHFIYVHVYYMHLVCYNKPRLFLIIFIVDDFYIRLGFRYSPLFYSTFYTRII